MKGGNKTGHYSYLQACALVFTIISFGFLVHTVVNTYWIFEVVVLVPINLISVLTSTFMPIGFFDEVAIGILVAQRG